VVFWAFQSIKKLLIIRFGSSPCPNPNNKETAMDKDFIKSTLSVLLNEIDYKMVENLIGTYGLNRYTKKLKFQTFLSLLIHAQLNQTESLTACSKELSDTEKLQKHLDLVSISTAQLSRKLSNLSPEIMERIFKSLVLKVQSVLRTPSIIREIGKLLVIDSTTMSMSLGQSPWANFRKTKAGIKLHLKVVVTKDITSPDQAIILPAKHADRTQMNLLIEVDSDAIHLFDRGYVDYKQFDQWCKSEVRFITRLKKNAEIEVLSEQTGSIDGHIFKDQEVYLGNDLNKTKMEHPLRIIETIDREGNPVTILTNCFDLTAKEIADLYRYRWKIETFFKWIKQHLKVRSFYGKSENAVKNQIWIALITYLLHILLQRKIGYEGSLLDFKRTLVNLLFEEFSRFVRTIYKTTGRTSKGRRKKDWEREFQVIEKQFVEGEVSHLNHLEYDPLFL